MGVLKREWLTGCGLAAILVTFAGTSAMAQDAEFGISTDRPGSIVLFPKVIADGTRDTVIQITNTSNSIANAHCVYIDGHGECAGDNSLCSVDEDCGTAGPCVPVWSERDFDITLTRQQPTVWRASTGRRANATAGSGTSCDLTCTTDAGGGSGSPCQTAADCPVGEICQAQCPGFSLFAAPPTAENFRGMLWCVQTDGTGGLLGGNALKGEAVLLTVAEGATDAVPAQVSVYNSINIPAVGQSLDVDDGIELNGEEYAACPEEIQFVHYNDRAEDTVTASLVPSACDESVCVGGDDDGDPCTSDADCTNGACRACPIRTEVTLVPCSQDLLSGTVPVVRANYDVRNEFELTVGSPGTDVQCWSNLDFGQIFPTAFATDSTWLRSRVRPSTAGRCQVCDLGGSCPATCSAHTDCGPNGVCAFIGLLGVVEEFYETDNSLGTAGLLAASAAHNVHLRGERTNGVCSDDFATSCTEDADCTAGICVMDRIIIDPNQLVP